MKLTIESKFRTGQESFGEHKRSRFNGWNSQWRWRIVTTGSIIVIIIGNIYWKLSYVSAGFVLMLKGRAIIPILQMRTQAQCDWVTCKGHIFRKWWVRIWRMSVCFQRPLSSPWCCNWFGGWEGSDIHKEFPRGSL